MTVPLSNPVQGSTAASPDQWPAEGSTGRGPLSRRGLLLGAAGVVGLAVGAAGAVAVESLPTTDPRPAGTASPAEDLMGEHGILKRILLIYAEALRRTHAGQPMPTQAVHTGAQIIHDYIEGFHEGLEEAYVFPRLQQAHRLADTVTTLLVQHARGRRITADVLRATGPGSRLTVTGTRSLTAALDSFARMYEVHEAREDTVVFPAFRAITPERTLAELGDRFASEQNRQFGRHAFDRIVDRVATIENSLHIYDLAQFTPQP